MQRNHGVHLAAASAALVLLLAGPALAISSFTQFKCENPAEADDIIRDYFFFFPINTGNLDSQDCVKFCKDLKKVCDKNVSAFQKCMKIDDKFWFKLQSNLCVLNSATQQDAKSCQASSKADQQTCKQDLAQDTAEGKADCETYFGPTGNGFCQNNCEDGLFN